MKEEENEKNDLINMMTKMFAEITKGMGDTRNEFVLRIKLFTNKVLDNGLKHSQMMREKLSSEIHDNVDLKEELEKVDFTPCLNILEQLENAYDDIIAGDKDEK